MATLKTLTRFSQAPTVPETIPADAIVAIEIDNKIYKMTFEDLVEQVAEALPSGDEPQAPQL